MIDLSSFLAGASLTAAIYLWLANQPLWATINFVMFLWGVSGAICEVVRATL